MLVTLPLDPSLPLLDVARQPRHVEMVEGGKALLRVDAGSHCLGRADQNADPAVVHVAEQPLLGSRLLIVLHEGNLGRRHAEPDQLRPDPFVGREAARLGRVLRTEVGEDHLRGAAGRVGHAGQRIAELLLSRLLPHAMHVADEVVQLVVGIVLAVGQHEPQVDRGVAAIGDDGEQDVVTLLGLARALLDDVDPLGKRLLVALEVRTGRRGEDLPLAGAQCRQFCVGAQVGLAHHVRDGAEHRDQVGDVDEVGKTRDRLVVARGLQLQLGHGVAEGRGPGVELVQAALLECVGLHEALQTEHLAHRVGDGRAGSEDQVPRRLGLRDVARLT